MVDGKLERNDMGKKRIEGFTYQQIDYYLSDTLRDRFKHYGLGEAEIQHHLKTFIQQEGTERLYTILQQEVEKHIRSLTWYIHERTGSALAKDMFQDKETIVAMPLYLDGSGCIDSCGDCDDWSTGLDSFADYEEAKRIGKVLTNFSK